MSATLTVHPNVYQEVTIGTQTWMLRNYDFGGIPYDNDVDNISGYGKLYTWDEAMAIDVPGWHLPADSEWSTLITYLGGTSTAAHIKEVGTTHWTAPNTYADNTSGFTAVASGNESGGSFYNLGDTFYCWTATEQDASNAWLRGAVYTTGNFVVSAQPKTNRCAVRLIKD